MAKFEVAILTDKLVRRATRYLMWTPLKPSDNLPDTYALGWVWGKHNEREVPGVGHTGGQQGTSTAFDHRDTPLPLPYYEKKYSLSRTTLWRYRKAGLPAIGVGAKTFIRESDFVTFLERMNGQTVSITSTRDEQ